MVANSTAQNGLSNPGELQFVLDNTSRNVPTAVAGNLTGANGTPLADVPGAGNNSTAAGNLPKLTGTISGGGHSMAVLQSGDETRVCCLNETMNGYTITEVTQFAAVLRDAQGQDHRLSLDLAQASNTQPPPAPPNPPGTLGTPGPPRPGGRPTGPMPAATPPADNTLSRSQIVDYMNNYQQWIGHLNVRPLKKGDEVIGIQVNYSTPDNPLAKLGVNAGDVLTSLNGHPLKSPEDLQWAYGELRNNTSFDFQVERGGKPTQLNVHLSDN